MGPHPRLTLLSGRTQHRLRLVKPDKRVETEPVWPIDDRTAHPSSLRWAVRRSS
jgi:hypothetical protein